MSSELQPPTRYHDAHSTSTSSQTLSSSLPSYFRYRPAPQLSRTPPSRFFNPYPEHDDPSRCPVPAVDSASAQTRLEALKGWEVSFTVLSLYFASAIALVYVLFSLHRAAESWSLYAVIPPLTTLDILIRSFLEFASMALPLYFVLNLMLTSSLTDEQIWTCALLAVGLLATNPLTRDNLTLVQPQRIIITDAVYTATIYLYLLMAAHSYRIVNPSSIHSLTFYTPKLAVAMSYVVVKLSVGIYARVSLGLIPFSRILTWITLLRADRAPLRVTVPVLLTAFMDTAFGFWLVREVATTSDFLATIPYVEHRAKQLGFRCFVYQTLAFCFNIIALAFLINIGMPASYLFYLCDNPTDFIVLEPPVGRLGLAIVYFTWTLVLAYVNLPPTPLLLPAIRAMATRVVRLVVHSRVAVWLGIADVVATADAEDSGDDDDDDDDNNNNNNNDSNGASNDNAAQTRTMHPITEVQPQSIPMQYRHRELFDVVPMTSVSGLPHVISSTSSAYPSDVSASSLMRPSVEESGGEDGVRNPVLQPLIVTGLRRSGSRPSSLPIEIPTPRRHGDGDDSYSDNGVSLRFLKPPDVPSPPTYRRRLRLRKNLFVMETQAMMVNAAYLSYIFGNPSEELPPQNQKTFTKGVTADTTATDMFDELPLAEEEEIDAPFSCDDDHGDENCAGAGAGDGDGDVEGHEEEVETQPERDDGTFFRVDPYAMAERYGYKVYRYIACESLNTHAVVLVGESRVIVAFSGTRDASNWRVNANLSRAVLDERLTRFEYELGEGDDGGCGNDNDNGNGNGNGAGNNGGPELNNASSLDVGGVAEYGYDGDCSIDGFADPYGSFGNTPGVHFEGDDVRRAGVMRSLSDDEVCARRVGGDGLFDEAMTPLTGHIRVQSYGAMRAPPSSRSGMPVRRAISEWLPSGRGSGPGYGCEGGVWGPSKTRMTRVASAFAHELLTFGKPKVHVGFLDAYMSIRKRVLGALVELYGGRNGKGRAASLPLFFSGHSLGGAMAMFGCYEAARYYKRIGIGRRQDVACTTFGCPKVGNEAFKMRYERLVETHWRFEMAADPIPKMPTVILNYVPVGVQVLIDQSGMLLIDPSFIEVQWWGRLTNLYLGYRMHIRASYCMALRMYCKLYRNGVDDLADEFWPFPLRVQTKGLFRPLHIDDVGVASRVADV